MKPSPLSARTLAAGSPGSGGAPAGVVSFTRDPEMNPRQNLIFLLQIAAEIEHTLLVEYLYAAYSLDLQAKDSAGTPLPVDDWQTTITQIAVEEMGHLMTVQNLLRFLGGPLHFDREHLPYQSQLYPFPFALEPLTKKTLAKYVFAEMPDPVPSSFTFRPGEREEIELSARDASGGVGLNHVGALYADIVARLQDLPLNQNYLAASTEPWQATAAERWRAKGGPPPTTPVRGAHIFGVSSVADAVAALNAVAVQGEGTVAGGATNTVVDSHFDRFIAIYRALPANTDPSLPVAKDPNTTPTPLSPLQDADGVWAESRLRKGRITNEVTMIWAKLFNVRYRMLLTDLAHALMLPAAVDGGGKPVAAGAPGSTATPRAQVIAWAFQDMQSSAGSLANLAAPILNVLPRTAVAADGLAGPPFELPFSLDVPDRPVDRWLVHIDLLLAVKELASAAAAQDQDAGRQETARSIAAEADLRVTQIGTLEKLGF